ncbi:MAG TPA: fibronectin type III domain-containing protein [Marmoricola sp.]|jgi:hypothetical protein|nr:fibronectin type III domain-containing protein [Marmoricola sp.]
MNLRPSRGLVPVVIALLVPIALVTAPAASAAGGVATRALSAPDVPGSVAMDVPDRSTTGTLTWQDPLDNGGSELSGFHIDGLPSGSLDVPASQHSLTVAGLQPGSYYSISVAAVNGDGTGPDSDATGYVSTWLPTSAPTMTVFVRESRLNVVWHAPANPGGATFSEWEVTLNGETFKSAYGQYEGMTISHPGNGPHKITLELDGSADLGTSISKRTATLTFGSTAPRIAASSSGARGGKSTATVRWKAPANTHGYKITGYEAIAYKLNSAGKIVGYKITKKLKASARSYTGSLPKGRYKFQVVGINSLGITQPTGFSKIVQAR